MSSTALGGTALNEAARGQLFIVSAPSGTGKTTLVERLVRDVPRLRMSRSYTSRGVRPGEADGVDYNFVSREDFEAGIAAGRFLEWADVFGNYYGTAREDTERVLEAGDDLVLVIDVQGARQVRATGMPATTVFVLPPSADTLEQRLRGRSRDTEEQMRRRLETARAEVDDVAAYDYVVVNDDLEHAAGRLKSIVLAERAKTSRMRAVAAGIVGTFHP